MLMALERGIKGGVWFSLIDKVYADSTLQLAWERVQSNAGACGVDGMTVGHFAKDSHNRLLAVKERLKSGTYQPKPVKRVYIPKPGSTEKRPLGIPTVTDRIVQAAVKMVVEPIFEREFAEHSYGFRPERCCKDALRRVDELLQSGAVHVVDVDIKGYFDSIPHQRLMGLVGERIADGRVLALIESFLKQGIMEAMGKIESGEREEGTPQGGVISPLLANIYLNPLDHLISRSGYEMVRYADDMVILCRSAKAAQEALAILREWSAQAGLELHPQKTKLVDMGQPKASFEFLGYKFWHGKASGRIRRFIRFKSEKKFREAIKPLTRRTSGQSMRAIAQMLKPRLEGEGLMKSPIDFALSMQPPLKHAVLEGPRTLLCWRAPKVGRVVPNPPEHEALPKGLMKSPTDFALSLSMQPPFKHTVLEGPRTLFPLRPLSQLTER
jgi:RNA-directed DNA polymerase